MREHERGIWVEIRAVHILLQQMAVSPIRQVTTNLGRSDNAWNEKIHSRFYSPLQLYSSFYSGVRSALCCQAERKGEQRRTRLRLQARPSTIYVLTLDLSFLFQFLAAFLKVAWRHFHSARCHVGRSGVGLFERGGPNQPLPAPPGVQGWRHRCLVLAATANLEPG